MSQHWPIADLQNFQTFSDWKTFIDGLDPNDLFDFSHSLITRSIPVHESLACYSAVIDRLHGLAYMAPVLTDEQRDITLEYANKVIMYTKQRFQDERSEIDNLESAISSSLKFYCTWGTESSREFLFNRGFIDQYGVELNNKD